MAEQVIKSINQIRLRTIIQSIICVTGSLKRLNIEILMNILNDIKAMSCPILNNNNPIELTVHTSYYWGLRLTLCYLIYCCIIV